MPAPQADKPRCDVYGCGMYATMSTDGSEVDALGRPAVPYVNICDRHVNWPHSEDAKTFTTTTAYKDRLAARGSK